MKTNEQVVWPFPRKAAVAADVAPVLDDEEEDEPAPVVTCGWTMAGGWLVNITGIPNQRSFYETQLLLPRELKALAHSMAAGPDLVKALQDLVARAEESLDYRPELRRAVDNAKAAIAKATGEA
jgi:hypothetical protein